MKTFEEAKEIIKNIDCEIFGKHFIIKFVNHGKDQEGNERWYIQVGMARKCMYTGKMGEGFGGKLYVSPYSTKDEIVKKVMGACLAYVEHETREGFFFNGKRIFNPHITIEALEKVADETMSREQENGN